MEKSKLLKILKEKELMVSPEGLSELLQIDFPNEIIEELTKRNVIVATKEQIMDIIESKRVEEQVTHIDVLPQSSYDPIAKSIKPRLELSIRNDITGNSRCTGSVEDFVRYFNSRFEKHRRNLRGMASNVGLSSLRDLKNNLKNKESRVIAMVYDKRVTKNGHLLFEILLLLL